MPNTSYSLTIASREYLGTLLALALVLVFIHIGLYLYYYQVEELPWLLVQLFDLDEENNIPTWYSSFLLLNCAFFLLLYSGADQTQKPFHWRLIGLGFFILAIDEVAGLHESFNSSIEMNWAIPGGILVLFVAAAFVPFLMSLPRRLLVLLLASGFLYVSGAIVVELLSEDMDSDTLSYMMAVAVEEGLEMLGALLFLATILSQMKKNEESEVVVDVTLE